MQASEFIWLHCFTHSLERLSPFYYSFHNICFCPLLLASHYFQSTLFSFQGAGYFPVFFKTRLKHLIAQVLQPKLEAALLKFSLLPFSFKRKEVVGPSGLEPPTSRLSVVRSSQLSYGPVSVHSFIGGGNRARTDDPLLAKQVLFQLSYTPTQESLHPLN